MKKNGRRCEDYDSERILASKNLSFVLRLCRAWITVSSGTYLAAI